MSEEDLEVTIPRPCLIVAAKLTVRENLPAEPCLSPCATAFIMSKEKTDVVLIKPSHSGVGLAT